MSSSERDKDWTGAEGAKRHEEADGMVFFLESGRAGAKEGGKRAAAFLLHAKKVYIAKRAFAIL